MGIAIDIFIVLFMMLSIFIGYKRGLIKVGIRLFALIIALLLTIILYRPIARVVMDKTQLDENISNTIYSKISDKDFNYFNRAEKYLYNELSIALNMPFDKTKNYIINKVKELIK